MKHKIISFFALILLSTSTYSEIIMHPVMDTTRNMVSHSMPLPASWKVNSPQTIEEPNISGPHDIKVFYRIGGMFTFSQDPYQQELYQATGQTMHPPLSAEQIMQQELAPILRKNGLQLIKQYPLPSVAQRNHAYDNKLFKSMPTQSSFDVIGSEWTDNKGIQSLVIVNQSVQGGQGLIFWTYRMQLMDAPVEHFEAAKKALIYGIVNTQDNPQQIQAYNASEQRKTNQSWAQHNSRMRQNQQSFDRQQQIHRDTVEATNNASMSAYRNRDASTDRSQQRTINSINEEETVSNPYNGQQYQIDSGANQTWMNADGEYIQSDDAFYDPNADYDAGYQDWEEVYPE